MSDSIKLTMRAFGALVLSAGLVNACGDGDSTELSTPGIPAAGSSHGGTGGTMSAAGGAGGSATGGASGAQITQQAVKETKLAADEEGVASSADPNLVNAWGLAINPTASGGPFFWVSSTEKGVSTVYDSKGAIESIVVTIPSANGEDIGSPTGQAFNSSTTSTDFKGDKFIFVTEDGLITGWQSGTAAKIRVDNSDTDANYKGVALYKNGTKSVLAAANFAGGTVDLYDADYKAIPPSNQFEDPTLPDGFAPFNVYAYKTTVYVAYAEQNRQKDDEVKGPGLGFVSSFKTDGSFKKRLVSEGDLNAPWGMAMSPKGWGSLAEMLLVGNFGDGTIHAYDPSTGELMGELTDSTGAQLRIDGLWALAFGSKVSTKDLSKTLYFTAGPEEEEHGLFGSLTMTK